MKVNKPWEMCQYVFENKIVLRFYETPVPLSAGRDQIGELKKPTSVFQGAVLKAEWVDKTLENKYYQ
ncbi:MAG: hypothetical protein ISS65_01685 [Desulfobacterales bacterium]|uniref:Uncharacterized protein n=1 Tax=Candidatus Desulfatibia profunda TaxID=2841695 RepID=A0A8J6NR49_9BACT|nr:hypothetical protein [Candidatus Desulfatibia profunda]MBL7178906.1 hypothetical protein [Desulfobacterales bacterium]